MPAPSTPEPRPPGGTSRDRPARRTRVGYAIALLVLLVGLIVTGALALVSRTQYTSNEKRLLGLRLKELGDVFTVALPNTETPLAAAAALADASNGNPQKFERYAATYVGRGTFVAVSLWRLSGADFTRIAAVGTPPATGFSADRLHTLLRRGNESHSLQVVGFLGARRPGLAYVQASPGTPGRFAVYAQSLLPPTRRSRYESNSAFSDLNYAVYLGRTNQPSQLLLTDLGHLPMTGPQATQVLPFGNTALTLTVSARIPLAGALPQRLPWIILIVGVVLSLGAAALTRD